MNKLKIGVASDHEGLLYKHAIITELENAGIRVVDLGVHDERPVDYPGVASKVAEAMFIGGIDRSILINDTGVGMCIAANKFMGIRATVCHDEYSARQGVIANDVNVLCLGEKVVGLKLAIEIVNRFVKADFSSLDHHRNQVAKILEIEAENMKEVL